MYPLFVFDKTKFPNWAGGTSAGKKHHSNHTPNTADKNQYYTIVAASDEQTKWPPRFPDLKQTSGIKYLELIVKQSKDSNEASNKTYKLLKHCVNQSKQILEMFEAIQA
jgi:hypothetical protein